MLNCRQVAEHGTDFLERQLTWRERLGLRLHLLLCPPCQRYVEQLRQTIGLLRGLPKEPPPRETVDTLLAHFRAKNSGEPR